MNGRRWSVAGEGNLGAVLLRGGGGHLGNYSQGTRRLWMVQGLTWVQLFKTASLDVGGQDSLEWVALLADFLSRRAGGGNKGAVAGGMAGC